MSHDEPHLPHLPRLREFVQQFTHLIDRQPDEAHLLQEGGKLLGALVADRKSVV